MTTWMAAGIALLPPFAVGLWFTLRGSLPTRLVAVQFTATMSALIMVTLSFAFGLPSMLDLALTLVLLSLPGSLLLAVFTERWL